MVAMGQRNPGVGPGGQGRRDARYDLEPNAGRGQCLQLFGGTAKINGSPHFKRTTVRPA